MSAPKPLYICESIVAKTCQQKILCCPHGVPHFKETSCDEPDCRFAPGGKAVCVLDQPVEAKPEEPVILNELVPPVPEEEAPIGDTLDDQLGATQEEIMEAEEEMARAAIRQDQPEPEGDGEFFDVPAEVKPEKPVKGRKKGKSA